MKKLMILVDNSGSYQYKTTLGKIYEVELVEGIFKSHPYYIFTDDYGKETACHVYRFSDQLTENT